MLLFPRTLPSCVRACVAGAALLGACATHAAPTPTSSSASSAPRAPLSLTYLGVAGWQISDARTTVLIDPYLSRPVLDGDVPAVVDEQALRAHVPARAQLVLVAHSHIDHLLDAPAVARLTGAQLVGTRSTVRYGLASGLDASQVLPVAGGEDYAFDGFSLRVLPSLHSALDHKHVSGRDEHIAADARPPLRPSEFLEGGTLAYLLRLSGHEVLALSTANYIERELTGLRPDVAIVATGLRQEIHDYTCRLMRLLGQPERVFANHFDAWREPLSPTPLLSAETRADLDAFVKEVHACAPRTEVVIPERFQTTRVD